MVSFRYPPLRSRGSGLRLIKIHHASPSDKVRCGMSVHPYAPPKYQALSYTWGDANRKVPISINGQDFLVTTNLDDALRHLRPLTSDEESSCLALWVDAVCINQENSNERDAQVRRMRIIYEQAERVILWLSKLNEPADESLQVELSQWTIGAIEENTEGKARSAIVLALCLKEEVDHRQSSEVSMRLEDCTHADSLQVWFQLARLFNRPWFERLWIIQELAVSRNAIVQWGNLQTGWPTLERAAKFILHPGTAMVSPHIRRLFPLLGAHRITQVALQSMYNFDTNNVLTILHSTQNTKCSDPRDRLYAIQGIVTDNTDIEIDYSIPVQQVYLNWARERIMRTRTLDVLSACADSSRDGDLPSWIPDLRRPFGQDKPLWVESHATRYRREEHGVPFLGSNPIRFASTDLSFSEDGLKIRLSGKFVGRVTTLTGVGDAVTNLRDPTELEARLREIIADWEAALRVAQAGGLVCFQEALLRSHYPWATEEAKRLDIAYEFWRVDPTGITNPALEDYVKYGHWDKSRHDATLREFERALFPRVHGCQMFTVEDLDSAKGIKRPVGIVAGNCRAKIGDELWMLSGGLTSFLLRRENELEHRLISPCFVYGHMHIGEVWAVAQDVVLI